MAKALSYLLRWCMINWAYWDSRANKCGWGNLNHKTQQETPHAPVSSVSPPAACLSWGGWEAGVVPTPLIGDWGVWGT